MSKTSRDVVFSETNSCGALHNLAKGLVPLVAAICRYLPLIDRSPAAIWPELNVTCRYFPLIVINCRYLPLTLSKTSSPEGLPKDWPLNSLPWRPT
jgi:hypothetical protein